MATVERRMRAAHEYRPPGARGSIWATAGAAALLALGFSRRRHGSAPRDAAQGEDYSGPNSRGPKAATPARTRRHGWKDILLRLYQRISQDRIIALAAGVTFYALLAIFPAIAALVAIYGLFADPGIIANHLNALTAVLPAGGIEVIADQVNRVAAGGASKLGTAFLVGLAISLWSANSGMKSLFDTLNVAYGENEKRGFFKLNLISLGFTFGAIFLLILALGAIAILPAVLTFVGLGSETELLIDALRWPALVLAVAVGIALVYRFGPSRTKARWRWISWGSAFASLLWLAVSILFSWYAGHFGSYNKTYGSLGAAVGFMTWMWLSIIVVLIGAELDAEIEQWNARDAPADHAA